ncbi:hypothetical protein [Sphingomonas leidyi]|uniref:hypothetical protein n=1 Tax=Sphingomonas TaxID=13687 RepID=UPI0010422EDB
MDLLIEAHCHLICSTRSLLAWGTTLQVAVENLDLVPAAAVAQRLKELATAGLSGREEHHLGAPRGVNETAARIAGRVQQLTGGDAPTILSIYIAALYQVRQAEPLLLRDLHARVRGVR